MSIHKPLSLMLIVCLLLGAAVEAQEIPDSGLTPTPSPNELNVQMRLQLDRTTITAGEPVYLSVTATRLASTLNQNIQVVRKEEAPLDLGPMDHDWVRSDFSKSPVRMCVMIFQTTVDGHARAVFDQPGDYRVRVRIGPDVTPLKLTVTAGPAEDPKAYAELGVDNMQSILTETFLADSPPALVEACKEIVQKYPESTPSSYCRAYLAIAAFKQTAMTYKRTGGKEVWGPIAEKLERVLPAHQDDFFGEEVGYYLAYAQGLSQDFMGATRTFEKVKTRMTSWGDLLNAMKQEVARHLRPKDVALPTQPAH